MHVFIVCFVGVQFLRRSKHELVMRLRCAIKGIDTPKTAASFLHVVNGKTSKKSVQKRRGGFWC